MIYGYIISRNLRDVRRRNWQRKSQKMLKILENSLGMRRLEDMIKSSIKRVEDKLDIV